MYEFNKTDSYTEFITPSVKYTLHTSDGRQQYERQNDWIIVQIRDADKKRIEVRDVADIDFIRIDGVAQTIPGTLEEVSDFLRDNNFFFDDTGDGDFSLETFKVTYYEIIDISGTTSGTLQDTPTGATIQEGEFGESGNSVLSTLNAQNKPNYLSPTDGNGDAITANLDTDGDWVSSDNFASPVALIYSFTILGSSWENVNADNLIDFYDVNPPDADEVRYDNSLSDLSATDVQAALDELDANSQGGSGGAFPFGEWTYSSFTFTPPANGEWRANNADLTLATEFYFADFNQAGVNVGNLLSLVSPGTILYLQQTNNANNYLLITVGSTTDQGTYVQYDASSVDVQGTNTPGALYGLVAIFEGGGVSDVIEVIDIIGGQDINAGGVFVNFDFTQSITAGFTKTSAFQITCNKSGIIKIMFKVNYDGIAEANPVIGLVGSTLGVVAKSLTYGYINDAVNDFGTAQITPFTIPVVAGEILSVGGAGSGGAGAALTVAGQSHWRMEYVTI